MIAIPQISHVVVTGISSDFTMCGNFNDATGVHFTCPFCQAPVDWIVRRGNEWFCNGCSRCWFAYTEEDKVALKVDRIANDEDLP